MTERIQKVGLSQKHVAELISGAWTAAPTVALCKRDERSHRSGHGSSALDWRDDKGGPSCLHLHLPFVYKREEHRVDVTCNNLYIGLQFKSFYFQKSNF